MQIAAALGKNVIAVDIDDAKLEKAKQEGAVAVVNAKRDKVPEAIKEITKGGAHASIEALVQDPNMAEYEQLLKQTFPGKF